MSKKVIFEKEYHGFEAWSDIDRDISEMLDSAYNPEVEDIESESNGMIKIVVTFESEDEQKD